MFSYSTKRVGDGQMLVEHRDAQIEFFLCDDQRRGDDEVAYPGLLGDAVGHHFGGDLIHHQRLAFHLVAHGVEGFLGGAVLDDLDREEEAKAAHVADRRVLCLEGFEFFADVRLERGGAFDSLRRCISSMVATAGPSVMGCAS